MNFTYNTLTQIDPENTMQVLTNQQLRDLIGRAFKEALHWTVDFEETEHPDTDEKKALIVKTCYNEYTVYYGQILLKGRREFDEGYILDVMTYHGGSQYEPPGTDYHTIETSKSIFSILSALLKAAAEQVVAVWLENFQAEQVAEAVENGP